MADLVYLVTQGNLFNYADDNSVSVNHTELHVVRSLRQPEAEVTVKWFTETAMKANATKFQGFSWKETKMFWISSFPAEDNLSGFRNPLLFWGSYRRKFDMVTHASNICVKASRQIRAPQRQTGFLDLRNRKIIVS